MAENRQVAFQGEHGAYSEQVLYRYFSERHTDSHPCEDFYNVFQEVMNYRADYAVLPVENSLEGTVISAYEQLARHPLKIHHEVIMPIHHCLLILPGTRLARIRQVFSHPQALGQCRESLAALGLKPEPFLDTAGAARALSCERWENSGAIASALAGHYYGLEIARYNLEDEPFNRTRFFILGRDWPATAYQQPADISYKTSIVFSGENRPNLLAVVLACFARYSIDLTKIESRPTRSGAWEYLFFLDFSGHIAEPHVHAALNELESLTTFLNILGSYSTTTYEP